MSQTNTISLISTKKLSNNIFFDDKELNKNLVFYKSNYYISWYNLVSSNCDITSKYEWKKDNIYYFSIIFNTYCDKPTAVLKTSEKMMPASFVRFSLIKEASLFELYSDLSNTILNSYNKKLLIELSDINKWSNIIEAVKKERLEKEIFYKLKILDKILDWRLKKYTKPVASSKLPNTFTKLPNSPRPYRQAYTDWIHQWFDFDTESIWEEVVSLDDWLIVRIVDNFTNSDYDKINYSTWLTYDDKLKNLDILRWNQVWIKTTKWDVAFYSHLNDIRDDLKVWYLLKRWEYVWTVWVTWVPVDWYDDYHLHLEIYKNYHKTEIAWKHSLFEYMKWDWYFKDKSLEYMLNNINNVFYE